VTQPNPLRRFLPAATGAVIVIVVVAGLIWVINGVLTKKATAKRQTVQIVKIIRPPPPLEQPPPPPPPPDKVEQPLPKDTPDEKPDQAPNQPLGLDADASAGTDGFGLAARKGGQDLIGSGAGAFAWYTNILKNSVLDTLSDDERIRRGNYSVIVRMWVTADGQVERIALTQASGNKDLDGFIQQALGHLKHIREAPPLEMPQPVTLRIVSRGA
jgi:periplasmic protein TonB